MQDNPKKTQQLARDISCIIVCRAKLIMWERVSCVLMIRIITYMYQYDKLLPFRSNNRKKCFRIVCWKYYTLHNQITMQQRSTCRIEGKQWFLFSFLKHAFTVPCIAFITKMAYSVCTCMLQFNIIGQINFSIEDVNFFWLHHLFF